MFHISKCKGIFKVFIVLILVVCFLVSIYDKLGNMIHMEDVESGQYLKSCTYDDMYRLITEDNHNTSSDSFITTYTYINDGRLQSKETKDKNLTTLAKETYTYQDAFNNGQYHKTTKTVEGETGSPSVVTTSYTDKDGRVAKTARYLIAQNCILHIPMTILGISFRKNL